MRAILDAAAYLTARERVAFILIDGRTFSRRQQIDIVLEAARQTGAGWRILRLICPDEIAEGRLKPADPGRKGHRARNRDVDLYRRLKREFDPITHPKLDVDSTQTVASNVEAVLRYLEARAYGGREP